MKFSLCTIFILTMNLVALAAAPDIKNLQFSIRKLDSMQGLMVQFTPPEGHHFNMEAPTKVSLLVDKKDDKGQIDKTPTEIKASWNQQPSKCQITAQLYICDDKNTYCVPIKKNFKCENLSYDDVKSTNADESSKSATTASAVEGSSSDAEKLFILNDSKKAFELATTEKKILLIDFFGIWCPPCNVLDESVFSTKDFKKLNSQFVFLKMDADSPVSWELKSKYNIKGYPTVILANAAGEEISRIVGSRKLKAFIQEMKIALKSKSTSMAQRRSKADSQKDPAAAFSLAELSLGQEDYLQAMKYFLIGQKTAALTDSQKQKMLTAQLGLLEDSKDANTQKNFAALLESSLEIYPYGVETYERATKLATVAEDLKDSSMKNRSLNAQFKNAEFLLKNPKLYADSEITEADLYVILADIYDSLKDESHMKESYAKAYDAYTRQIQELKLDESKERGINLERIYCLYKSGKFEEANTMYEGMQKQYPEEFTFYYSHANVLNEEGKNELALNKAEQALKYSYGDNQLRAVKMVADLKSKTGKKKEAISLLDETLKNYKIPEDTKVRTHRYLAKLKELKTKLQEK